MIEQSKSSLANYFKPGTKEWRNTVKICIGLGFAIGLFWGVIILLDIL